jgi:hypothetical protein
MSTKQTHARKGASAAGDRWARRSMGPSIDGIVQKPDEVVGEVVAVLDATLSHVAYAAAPDEISL